MNVSGIVPRSIRVRTNGIELHCLEWGATSGFPLVLLHGLRGHAHSWDDVSCELGDTYRVLALDQRGRGDSDWAPGGDYSMQAFVADLKGFCDVLGLERIGLIGHSMGGRNAIAFASACPERVAAFVIVDVGPEVHPTGAGRIRDEVVGAPERFDSFDAAFEIALQENRFAARDVVRRRLEYQTRPLTDGGVAWRYDSVVREQVRSNTRAVPPDLWTAWRQLKCPALIVRGAETDVLSPGILQRMIESRPGTAVVEIPRAGHMVFEDNPQAFVTAVKAWLRAELR